MLKELDPQTSLPVPIAEAFTMTSLPNQFETICGRKVSQDEVKVLREKLGPICEESPFFTKVPEIENGDCTATHKDYSESISALERTISDLRTTES